MEHEYDDYKFYDFQNEQLHVTYRREQEQKNYAEYSKKEFWITFLCQGIPLILTVILYIRIRDANFFEKLAFLLVYAGIPAFILSFIQSSALSALKEKYNIY